MAQAGATRRRAVPLTSEGRLEVVFGNGSHLSILEKEADLYLAAIRDFLDRRTGSPAAA